MRKAQRVEMTDRRGDGLEPLHCTFDRRCFDILVSAGDSLLDTS